MPHQLGSSIGWKILVLPEGCNCQRSCQRAQGIAQRSLKINPTLPKDEQGCQDWNSILFILLILTKIEAVRSGSRCSFSEKLAQAVSSDNGGQQE